MNQNMNDRRRYITWIFLPTVIAIAIQSALVLMAIEFYIVFGMASFKGGDYTSFVIKIVDNYLTEESTAWIQVVYAIITSALAVMIFKKLFRENKLTGLKGKSVNPALTVGGVVLFSVGMQYVTIYLMNSVASAFPSWLEEYEQLMESAGISSTMSVAMTLYAILLGPVCEELLFRGITFGAAKKVMHVYYAIIVQAIMFGAFHMNKLQGIYAFVLGLGLGYIMYLYDSLILTIIIHILYNLIGTIGSEYLPTGGDNLISFFFCTLSALVVSYISIILLKKGSALVNKDASSTDI